MRRWRVRLALLSPTLIALLAIQLAPVSASSGRSDHVLRYRAAFEARLARMASSARGARAPAQPTLNDFTLVGRHDLGAADSTGDVWVHENTAYLGAWANPCSGLGVKVVNVSNPASPMLLGRVAGIPGTSAEDVVVRSVSTASFTGDLLVAGIQRCDFEDPALDDDMFGVDVWDVSNPAAPVHFGHFGITTGGGGVHELDLVQRGPNVYALVATPFSEWFDPVNPNGDFWIVDVTNPASPALVGEWGAAQEGLSPGPFHGIGTFGATFAHSARSSADGTQAFVSYWDLGIVTLDISDVTNPTFVSHTVYPPYSDGDAHSLVPYSVGGRDLLLTNDEDFDTRSPAKIRYARAPAGEGSESPFAAPLWSEPNHRLGRRTVRPVGEGCSAADYRGLNVDGRIAVPKTYLTLFDPPPVREPACRERKQDRVANRLGAAAVVHDVFSQATNPQFFDVTDVPIPVLYTDHATGRGIVRAGRATLVAREPSWGYLRVFDADSGQQVTRFDDLPFVHDLVGALGFWSIHNTEVWSDRAYAAWYSHGIVALDLSPLAAATPGAPVMVGQFVPEPDVPPQSEFLPPGIPIVWGVFIDTASGLVYVSDIVSGLWIVDPTGDAQP